MVEWNILFSINFYKVRCISLPQRATTCNISNFTVFIVVIFVKLRQGSGKDRQGMAVKAKGLKACLELTLKLVATHPPGSLNKWLDEPVRGQVRLVKVRGGV